MKLACVVVLGLTAYGVFIGIFGGYAWMWTSGAEGNWAWWQYALAVPAIGCAALAVEAVLHLGAVPLQWGGAERPLWKRAVYFLFVLTLGIALVLGPWWLATLPH